MEKKLLKAAVFAVMLGVAGSSLAANYSAPSGAGNKYNAGSSNQTVVGTNNVTDGASATAYGHLNYAIGKNTTAIGHGARTDDGTGSDAGTGAEGATAVGNFVTASGNYSVAIGSGDAADTRLTATGAQSIAIGYMTEASADNATAFGNTAKAQGGDSVAIGTKATATDSADNGLALGTSSNVSKKNAVALGTSSNAASENAMAFGNGSRVAVSSNDAVAIGTNAYVKVANAVAIGKDAAVSATSGNPKDRVVSFGHTATDTYINSTGSEQAYGSAQTSRLINVTAGYQDTDATNFSQIKTTKPTYDTGSTSYIQSSLDGTTLNAKGTVGANIAALDAKMVATKTATVNTVDLGTTNNKIVSNDGTVLATFKKGTLEEGTSLTATDFVTNGDVYAAIAARSQKISLSTATTERDKVNNKDVAGNTLVSNDGEVLATFESEKPNSLDGKKFVTSGDVFAADVKSGQEVTLDSATTRETVNEVAIKKNQIATNDGTVLATFTSEKPAALDGTAFVTSGNVYAADVKEGQSVNLSTDKRETVNGTDIQKKQIATNEGKVLATFEDATYTQNDKGFVSGGLLWSQSIAAGQTPSFATDNNVIKNNNEDVLVTFTEGVVAVPGGAKGATNTDANFVSARNAYANDVAYAQTFTLDGNNVSGSFVTNAGATVGTVTITRGSVAEGNIGFVTGDDVWKAIAKYNQTIDFSKVDTSTNTDTATNDIVSNGDEGGSETGGTGSDGTGTGSGEEDGSGTDTAGGDTTGDDTTGGDTTGGDGDGDQGGDSGETTEQFSNKIYANDGTVIATFKQAEIKKDDTGFATGGQVYGQALEENQTVSFDETNEPGEGETDTRTNIIKNNAGDTLVTFKAGEAKENDTGFVSGDAAWKGDVQKGTVSFANIKAPGEGETDTRTNVIKNNAGDTLVTFEAGEAKEGDTGFVSGDAAWKGDVKKDTLTLESDKNAVIQNNNNETLVTIKHGTVEEGNTGFVSGGDVYENTKNIKADISKDIETVKTEVKENFEKVNTEITNVNERVDQTNQTLTNLGGQVNEVEDRVSKVGAGAAALAALHPLDYDPNAKLTFAIGYGNYRSKSAAAIGAFIRPNNRFMWSLGATMGNGENMYNTGLSFAIGSGKGLRMSRAELDFKVGQISEQMTQIETERQIIARDNAQQDAAILDLHARLQKVEQILANLTK